MNSTRRQIAAQPLRSGDVVVTPLLEVTELSIGSATRGFAVFRARPKALEVRRGPGPSRVLKIPDPGPWLRLVALTALVMLIVVRRKDA